MKLFIEFFDSVTIFFSSSIWGVFNDVYFFVELLGHVVFSYFCLAVCVFLQFTKLLYENYSEFFI